MLRRVGILGATAGLLVLSLGCGGRGPAAAQKSPQAKAREAAEMAAASKRYAESDKMAKKMEQAEREAHAKEQAVLDQRTISLGQSVKFDSLEITAESVDFRKVKWRPTSNPNRGFEQAGPFLVITLKAKNTSKKQKFKPETRIQGTDSAGNDLKSPFPELSLPQVEGSMQYDELGPGETATIVVCAQRKQAKARSYEFEMTTTASDSKKFDQASQRWLLKCNADEIKPAD